MILRALPSPLDPEAAFRALPGPRAVLESLGPGPGTGRWTILAGAPRATIRFENEQVILEHAHGREEFPGEPFAALRAALRRAAPTHTSPSLLHKVPFAGGALGWLGYELGRRLEPGKFPAPRADADPPIWLGIHGAALVLDRTSGEAWIAATGTAFSTAEEDAAALQNPETGADPGSARNPEKGSDPGYGFAAQEAEYRRGVARIRELIGAGDLYQANLSARFEAAGAPVDVLWSRLRATSPEPFAACVEASDRAVLCASMERLLSVRGRDVETRPIKGTIARGVDPDDDARNRVLLETSEKDRAELLMIVDIHRNDLGKVCVPGSVVVPTLFGVRTFAHVHHLEAVVQGRLRDGADALDALRAVFPAGSITGAPKIRAMQVIEELEPSPRGVYCGAIGYLGFDGAADFAVAIRTAVLRDGVLRWSAGGGIVWDSDPAREWEEVLVKSRGMRRLCAG